MRETLTGNQYRKTGKKEMKKTKNLLVILVILINTSIAQVRIHAHLTHFFAQEPIPTEKSMYQTLLKKPIDFDINYIAIPWSVLINTQKMNLTAQIKIPPKNFTVCQHAYYEKYIPQFQNLGIEIVFASTPPTNEPKGIITIPYPLYPVNGTPPAPKKDIYYSFIGFIKTHPVREKLFHIKHPPNCTMIRRNDWHFSSNSSAEKNQYKNVLSRSRFSLCPRGTSPNSMRFWESLQAGAIPILISDALKLPEVIDWNTCIIRVAEKDVNQIPSILQKIPLDEEIKMRKRCLEIYKFFFDDQTIYIKLVLEKLLCQDNI